MLAEDPGGTVPRSWGGLRSRPGAPAGVFSLWLLPPQPRSRPLPPPPQHQCAPSPTMRPSPPSLPSFSPAAQEKCRVFAARRSCESPLQAVHPSGSWQRTRHLCLVIPARSFFLREGLPLGRTSPAPGAPLRLPREAPLARRRNRRPRRGSRPSRGSFGRSQAVPRAR